MPGLKAVEIDLSESEQQELEQLLRRTSTPQQIDRLTSQNYPPSGNWFE